MYISYTYILYTMLYILYNTCGILQVGLDWGYMLRYILWVGLEYMTRLNGANLILLGLGQ